MKREHRILSVLWQAFPLAPRSFLLCEDAGVIGAPFYVMERRRGVVIRRELPPAWAENLAVRRTLSEALVDVMVALHAVAFRTIGLADLGLPEGFMQRQVTGWAERWERARDREVPAIAALAAWLGERVPPLRDATLVHSDLKLDNVMFADTRPVTPVAVLDWEQATIGDPLVDLGWLLGLWLDPGETTVVFGGANAALLGHGEVPTRVELAQRYETATGRDLTHLAFYCVLGLFKLACVMEGSYARFRAGTSDDAYFAALEVGVPALAQRALEFAGGAS